MRESDLVVLNVSCLTMLSRMLWVGRRAGETWVEHFTQKRRQAPARNEEIGQRLCGPLALKRQPTSAGHVAHLDDERMVKRVSVAHGTDLGDHRKQRRKRQNVSAQKARGHTLPCQSAPRSRLSATCTRGGCLPTARRPLFGCRAQWVFGNRCVGTVHRPQTPRVDAWGALQANASTHQCHAVDMNRILGSAVAEIRRHDASAGRQMGVSTLTCVMEDATYASLSQAMAGRAHAMVRRLDRLHGGDAAVTMEAVQVVLKAAQSHLRSVHRRTW